MADHAQQDAIHVLLPPYTDGELLQALLQLLQDYGYDTSLHSVTVSDLLAAGLSTQVRLLGTPTPSLEHAP